MTKFALGGTNECAPRFWPENMVGPWESTAESQWRTDGPSPSPSLQAMMALTHRFAPVSCPHVGVALGFVFYTSFI